jgi:multimeric flavodoxin WrbA
MRLAILDGDERPPGTLLDQAIVRLVAAATARGATAERIRLRNLRLHQCVGCFDCWVRSPGRCRLRDDGSRIVAAAAGADVLVFASPLIMGFTSALLKRAHDRILPILLPYIRVVDGECHHGLRYQQGPDVALLYERGDATDGEVAATVGIYARFVKNIGGRLAWVREAGDEEAHHALDAA